MLESLGRRLKEPYRFSIYAADRKHRSVNFGVLLTYRQRWTPIAYQVGELVKTVLQGVEYDAMDKSHLLSVTLVDGSTSFTIPALLELPASGTLIARSTALMGTIDLMNFSGDKDGGKITGFSSQPMQIN